MMPRPLIARLCRLPLGMLLVVLPTIGCRMIERKESRSSPLVAAQPSPDSVGLEIFFARFPYGDREINEALWTEVDEQQFPADLRRRLAESGFRAGVIGSHVPDELVKLLKLSGDAPKEKNAPVNLTAEPTVTLRVLQTRSGHRNEVVTSHVYDQLSLLESDGDQVRGRAYEKAEGRFALAAFRQPDGRARLELVPELHHGEARQRWVGTDGIMRLESGRPRRVFENLKINAVVSPGQMLVVTSLVDRPGSTGHHFFTEPVSEQLAQKLLIVRLAQAGSDPLFAAAPAKAEDTSLSETSP